MKIKSLPAISLVAILSASLLGSSLARPGGTYNGKSKKNATTPNGGSAMTFNPVDIKLKLPNGKGKVRGTLFTTQDGYPANVPINGKIIKATERQGGSKHILKAKWSWQLGAAGFPGTATGTNRIVVKGSNRGYKFQPPVPVKVRGATFKFTSKVSAKK